MGEETPDKFFGRREVPSLRYERNKGGGGGLVGGGLQCDGRKEGGREGGRGEERRGVKEGRLEMLVLLSQFYLGRTNMVKGEEDVLTPIHSLPF